jgi:putative acetyltransferase
MTEIVIAATPAPTAEVAVLIGALNDELAALYTPEQRHGLALEALFQPHVRFFVAWREGGPAGCAGVAFFDGFAEVKRMYVRPDMRGQGVADALMDHLAAETVASGRGLLRLETGVHQRAAIGFYRRHGFGACEAFAPYTAMPPEAVVTSVFMEKRLLPPGAVPA